MTKKHKYDDQERKMKKRTELDCTIGITIFTRRDDNVPFVKIFSVDDLIHSSQAALTR